MNLIGVRAYGRGGLSHLVIFGPASRKSIFSFDEVVYKQTSESYAMESEAVPTENIDELRQRLNNMKKLMAERQAAQTETEERRRPNAAAAIIDGSFLSIVFGIALVVILTVSVYAFYNLYNAILKKFPSKHTEL